MTKKCLGKEALVPAHQLVAEELPAHQLVAEELPKHREIVLCRFVRACTRSGCLVEFDLKGGCRPFPFPFLPFWAFPFPFLPF